MECRWSMAETIVEITTYRSYIIQPKRAESHARLSPNFIDAHKYAKELFYHDLVSEVEHVLAVSLHALVLLL